MENSVQTLETKQNYISFDNLKSNTVYELKVFIETLNGYNPERYLFANFTTKFESESINLLNLTMVIFCLIIAP